MISLILAFTVMINQAPIPVVTFHQDGQTLIEIQPIVRELNASFEQFELTEGWRIEIEGHTIVLGTDSRFIVLDGELTELSTMPVISEGKCFLPLDFYQDILCPLILAHCRSGTQSLIISRRGNTDVLLTDLQLHYLTGFTKVVLTFDEPTPYSIEQSGNRATLRLGRPLHIDNPLPLFSDPLVSEIIPGRRDLLFQLSSSSLKIGHYTLQNPYRIILDISRSPDRKAPDRIVRPTLAGSQAPSRYTVVIDPGHGGKDTGAHNKQGVIEKEITLKVARMIQQQLEKKYGYHVYLTRSEDVGLGLDERTAMANEVRAHVFVSIHANSAKTSAAHGAEVYYLTLDTVDQQLKLLADDENLGMKQDDSIQFILWDLAQSANLSGSARLAEMIAKSLAAHSGLPERGVKQAPFRVLMGATMPATLVELGFLTNPADVELLLKEEYLTTQAKAISEAIHTFYIETGDRWLVN